MTMQIEYTYFPSNRPLNRCTMHANHRLTAAHVAGYFIHAESFYGKNAY